ncbi:MAG: tetratricopeptide repeat protein, partial [Acidobacteria bacterium]|nr:tetratricopeptide repeat protein [Acidobacteriota bacterium]
MDPAWAAAIGWSIVFSHPPTIVLGVWAILAWVVLLAPAFSGAERRLVLAWLVLLVVAAPASRALALLEEAPTREDVRVASTAAERTLTPSLVRDLARLALERPHEAIWRVLLAEACAERYPDRAVLLLRDAARLDPRDPRIRVSLGNVFFRLGKHETAGVHYREALDLDRSNVAALLNLSKVRLAEFDFAGAEALSEDARRADAALFERVVSALGEGEVADPEVPPREVRSHVMRSIVVPS